MSLHLPNEWTFCPWFVSLFSEPSVCIKFRLQESPKGNGNISWQSILIKCRKTHNTEINHLHGSMNGRFNLIWITLFLELNILSSVSKSFQFIFINCEINLLSSYLIIGYLKTRFEPKYLELSVCIEICLHESSKGMIHKTRCTHIIIAKVFSFWSVLLKRKKKNVTKYSIIFFCNFGA